MTKTHNGVPVYRPDVYGTEAIIDPHPHYRRMRELGAVVWLPKQRVYALPQFAECKAVLRIELTGSPTWAINNVIRRHERLPIKLLGV